MPGRPSASAGSAADLRGGEREGVREELPRHYPLLRRNLSGVEGADLHLGSGNCGRGRSVNPGGQKCGRQEDGRDSTRERADLTERAGEPVRLILLRDIALAGFHRGDIHALHAGRGRPVLVVARRPLKLSDVRPALLEPVLAAACSGGQGMMEPCAGA